MPSRPVDENDLPFAMPMRYAAPNLLADVMLALAGPCFSGKANRALFARSLLLEDDEFLPLGKTLHWLGFVELGETNIRLTKTGRKFVHASDRARKNQFADAVLKYAGQIAAFYWGLLAHPEHRFPASPFRDLLEEPMPADYAAETLRGAVNWGRYAGLFGFDEESQEFSLECATAAAEPEAVSAQPAQEQREATAS
jgi:NitT/TauT family transport system ATP-binding protein